MPYKSRDELPDGVKSALGKVPHAQEIYKEAFNSAWDEYKDSDKRRDDVDREEVAHRVAWKAVKTNYQKGSDNKWQLKNQ